MLATALVALTIWSRHPISTQGLSFWIDMLVRFDRPAENLQTGAKSLSWPKSSFLWLFLGRTPESLKKFVQGGSSGFFRNGCKEEFLVQIQMTNSGGFTPISALDFQREI